MPPKNSKRHLQILFDRNWFSLWMKETNIGETKHGSSSFVYASMNSIDYLMNLNSFLCIPVVRAWTAEEHSPLIEKSSGAGSLMSEGDRTMMSS